MAERAKVKKVGAIVYVFDDITKKWYTRDEYIRIVTEWAKMQIEKG